MAVISSQLNNARLDSAHELIFRRRKHPSLHFSLALFFSVLLIFSDYHYQYLSHVRRAFSLLVTPLQYAVDYPVRMVQSLQTLFSSRSALIDENMRLHYQQTLLAADVQKLLVLQEENTQLKQLLQTSAGTTAQIKVAQILAADTTKARQLVVIDKGRQDGVFEGLPVLDAHGVMGQIIDVGYLTSTVLLISDSKCAVPVRNYRTGEQAILVGKNRVDKLSLINLPKTSKVAVGDVLITSGLGQRYPEGFPVGEVTSVKNVPSEDFIEVTVMPKAGLNSSRMVLLVWPDERAQMLTQQVNERMSVIGRDL